MRAVHDVIVVGGGPAGAAAATLLARAGHHPLLLEREKSPRHKVCGDFVSVEAQASLRDLDVDLLSLGAVAIDELRVVHGHDQAATPLPFRGLSLTRRALDEELLRRSASEGVHVVRGVTARDVTWDGNEQRLSLAGGETLRARAVFLATGKHDLKSITRTGSPGLNDYIGFKTYLSLHPQQRQALEGVVELVLFSGCYAGLQMVENGTANLCLLVKRSVYEGLGRTWDKLVAYLCRECPHLAQRLDGATEALPKPISIFSVPYGFVHRWYDGNDGLYRLGDQAAVIPSLAGDGIAMALHSARLAACTHIQTENSASRFHRRFETDVTRQVKIATLLHHGGRTALGRKILVRVGQVCPASLRAAATWTRVCSSARQS